MDSLETLVANVTALLQRCQALEKEVDSLREANDNQRQEMMRTHGELVTLQQKYRDLQTAYALVGGRESRDNARQYIANLIAQVDRAIDNLSH